MGVVQTFVVVLNYVSGHQYPFRAYALNYFNAIFSCSTSGTYYEMLVAVDVRNTLSKIFVMRDMKVSIMV